MKALLLTEYKQMEVTDVDEPEVAADDVLVQVEACGICGSDIHGYDGSTGRRIPPLVMGHEAAGVVVSSGSNVTDLQERLQLLKQDPNIDQVNGQLGPGVRRGESVLTLAIAEAAPFFWAIHLNNHRSPSVGSFQAEIDAGFRNIFGRGDVLSLSLIHI